jgi:hypothetical protein
MGIFTAIAIAAAVGAGGAAISNTQRRRASTARNTLNAVGIKPPANKALDAPKATKPGPGAAGATGAGARTRPRGRKQSKTQYTGSQGIGLSDRQRSTTTLKLLTGQ